MKERTMKNDMSRNLAAMPAPTVDTTAAGLPGQVAQRRLRRDPIVWAVGKHPRRPSQALGNVLLARSTQGVCAILLGEEKALLAAELARYFPDAPLQEDAAALDGAICDWWAFIDAPSQGFPHPLDIAGTPLQQQVWDALRAIPPGTTLTYSELAARVGRPQAVRAVASACAANRLAVVIPCHRVIGRSGSLTGYRWGIDRKRSLLEMEART
jgi:AraC family transcriptional regulator of adaptative response/methylated-DNA-[protein]-cysteine methyltransferase